LTDAGADSGDQTSKSRAGRDLPAAIGSGLALGAIVLLSLFTWKWTFGVVLVAALLVSVRELIQAFGSRGIKVARTPLLIATVLLPTTAFIWGLSVEVVVLGITVLFVMFWRIRLGTEGYVRDVSASIFVAAYVPFVGAFVMLTLAADDGPKRVLVFILLTVANDIGGYVAGVFFGRHPIAAQISPKKSWEGFAGSIVLQSAVGATTFVLLLDAPWWQGVLAGVVLTVTATAGDFSESAMKRDLGIKDMGRLLPGHGGMMDRLDSLIPNAFASWVIFTIFLGSGIS
jgi:phosphatidate cytidylyltransferase